MTRLRTAILFFILGAPAAAPCRAAVLDTVARVSIVPSVLVEMIPAEFEADTGPGWLLTAGAHLCVQVGVGGAGEATVETRDLVHDGTGCLRLEAEALPVNSPGLLLRVEYE